MKRISRLFNLPLVFAALALGGAGWPLAGLSLPQVDPLRATMLEAPRNGVGLTLLDATNRIRYLHTSYRLEKTGLSVDLYLSRDAQDLRFGPSNLALEDKGAPVQVTGSLGYRVLAGRPSYLQVRKDGLWILYVFPDEVLDVAGFIRDFNGCLAFFETRLPKAGLADWLPSLVGVVQGVR